MPLQTTNFDTRLHYEAAWVEPHHDSLDFGRRNIGWEDTAAGRFLYDEMATRGLSEADVGIFLGHETLAVTPPAPLATSGPAILLANAIPSDPAPLRLVLDLSLANLARETMMRKDGWKNGGMPPAWSLVTTPITEQLLALSGLSAYDLWRAVSEDCDFGVTFSHLGAETQHHLSRHGPMILTQSCELAPGITLAQDQGTYLQVCTERLKVPLEAAPGATLGDVVDLAGAALREYLAGLSIKSASLGAFGDNVFVNLAMPVCTMSTIPGVALEAVGLHDIAVCDEVRPVWTCVKRLPHWVPPLPARDTERHWTSNEGIFAEIEPNGGPLTDVCLKAIDKQPELKRHEVRRVIANYLAFRRRQGNDPVEILTEHVVFGSTWTSSFLNAHHPGRDVMTMEPPTREDAERRVAMTTEVASEVRALRTFYAEMNFAGLRSSSPLDSKHWDEPPRMAPSTAHLFRSHAAPSKSHSPVQPRSKGTIND